MSTILDRRNQIVHDITYFEEEQQQSLSQDQALTLPSPVLLAGYANFATVEACYQNFSTVFACDQ